MVTDAAAREIARVEIVATANAPADNVPVTFGHLFSAGDVPRTSTLQAQLPSGEVIPLQFDRKATHPDGSIRHGIVTIVIPRLEPQKNLNIALHSVASAKPAGDVAFGQLLPKTIPVEVRLKLSDGEYRADINELLKNKPAQKSSWLSGPLAEEILLSARFKDGQGTPHPHLTLKCALRAFRDFDGIRMDFAIENTAAFAPAPRNYRYDVSIKIGEKIAFEKKGLNHARQARWRKILWLGQEPGAQALVDRSEERRVGKECA